MKSRVWMGSFMVLALSAGLVVACGDDDDPATPTPDSGTPPVPTGDSGNPPVPDSSTPDAPAADGGVEASAPITPQTTTRIPNAINPYGLTFASDGFLYASGATIDDTSDRVLAVWRFKDGVLDTTFGTGGVVTTAIDGAESSFGIVEVSPGNFVVQATTSGTAGKVYLVKLTKDGAGAFSFGTPVVVPFDWTDGDFSEWPGANPPVYNNSWSIGLDKSVAATPKIVVFAHGAPAKVGDLATQRTDNDRWVARVLADTLAPDPAFNDGKAFTTDGDGKGLPDNARRGLVLADGTIVSAGYTDYGTGLRNHVVLVRLKPDGKVDPTFGFGTTAPGVPGQTKVNPFVGVTGGFAEAYAVVRQSGGRLVTTGYGTTNFEVPSVGLDMVVLGFKADGLDPTFGKLGAFAWQSEGDKGAGLGAAPFTDRGRDMTILPDDRLVFAGVYDDYASIFVLDKDGKPDKSVGVNGVIEYSYPAAFFKVVASPDGKQIAATAQSLNQTGDAAAPLGSVLVTLKVGQ
ncbi:MAG: hypothetical protein KF819_39190 [Labilithrix sp.]|nr:hypothetical protein [Labilithrix sp.]